MRKAGVLLQVYLAYMLEYRAELLLWALAGVLPLILMGVWMEAARVGSFPLSSGEFARYFLMAYLVRQLTVVWVVWEFERDVVEGRLSFRLLKPLGPFFEHLAAHVAERLARFPFVLFLVGFFFLLFPEARFLPSWADLLLGLLLTAFAFLLRYLMQYTTALLTFWSEPAPWRRSSSSSTSSSRAPSPPWRSSRKGCAPWPSSPPSPIWSTSPRPP